MPYEIWVMIPTVRTFKDGDAWVVATPKELASTHETLKEAIEVAEWAINNFKKDGGYLVEIKDTTTGDLAYVREHSLVVVGATERLDVVVEE